MVARLQGWYGDEFAWEFIGRKTSRYRQIGNAFPPPVARALGEALASALLKTPREGTQPPQLLEPAARMAHAHDAVYRLLRDAPVPLTATEIAKLLGDDLASVQTRIDNLRLDFELEESHANGHAAFRVVQFKAFTGQPDHARRQAFEAARAKIS
jgi:DNA (cytosine-5)-methyltransferase 1